MNSWRFLNSGRADGATNMAVDEAILAGVRDGSSPPTLRVYAWEPPTVSIGHSQKASTELDLQACARKGFGVVRRPTGGRAVLHAGELTYSVVGPSGVPPLGGSIAESYRAIAAGLMLGLTALGIHAELAPASTASRSRGEVAPPCFVSAGRFEVVVEGRKLIGSAQRRVGAAVLQHGSLLTDGTHLQIADVLRVRKESERAAIRRTLALKATDLAALISPPVGFEVLAGVIRTGFENAWGITLSDGTLTERESEAVVGLTTDHYAVG
ncbi:MAG: lipoate--protein ligase family protein [Candidatus Eisenbacteria bacterium]